MKGGVVLAILNITQKILCTESLVWEKIVWMNVGLTDKEDPKSEVLLRSEFIYD